MGLIRAVEKGKCLSLALVFGVVALLKECRAFCMAGGQPTPQLQPHVHGKLRLALLLRSRSSVFPYSDLAVALQKI